MVPSCLGAIVGCHATAGWWVPLLDAISGRCVSVLKKKDRWCLVLGSMLAYLFGMISISYLFGLHSQQRRLDWFP